MGPAALLRLRFRRRDGAGAADVRRGAPGGKGAVSPRDGPGAPRLGGGDAGFFLAADSGGAALALWPPRRHAGCFWLRTRVRLGATGHRPRPGAVRFYLRAPEWRPGRRALRHGAAGRAARAAAGGDGVSRVRARRTRPRDRPEMG